MSREFELNEELLQRYYDGELEEAERRRVEKALEQDASAREFIEELAGVSRAMAELARECEPDDVSARRVWEKIARRLHSGRRVR
ncbi:MAG: zf-HC2 domain-containing protein, partial [Candidatus Glassbacteria bacterium]